MIYVFCFIAIVLTIIFLVNSTPSNFLQKIQLFVTLCIVAMLIIIYDEIVKNGSLLVSLNTNLLNEAETIKENISEIKNNYLINVEALKTEIQSNVSTIKTTLENLQINTAIDNVKEQITNDNFIIKQYATLILDNLLSLIKELR